MSNNLNNLPSEITEAILRLLPLKSLGRFKCVSTTWNSLISGSRFIKTHLLLQNHNHHTRKLILFKHGQPLIYSLDVTDLIRCLNTHVAPTPAPAPHLITGSDILVIDNSDPMNPTTSVGKVIWCSPFLHTHFLNNASTEPPATTTATELGTGSWCQMIYGSCNGLVLAEDENRSLLVINPTTKDLWNVPPSPFPEPHRPKFLHYGFAYTDRDDDYLIVSLSYWDRFYGGPRPSCTDTLLSIYSFRRNSWTRLPNSPIHHNMNHNTCTSVVVNGKFHWLASNTTIVAFDIAAAAAATTTTSQVLYNEIQLSNSLASYRSLFSELIDVGGKLAFVGAGRSMWKKELWVMEEYGVTESWTEVCSVKGYIDSMSSAKPLCLESRWIPLRPDVSFSHHDDEVVVYDLNEARCSKVKIVGGPGKFIVAGAYVETLESPRRLITPPSVN